MNGIAWEINYRGELDFWHQAMAQKESRNLFIEDGWLYFVHGWTQVIAEVLHIDLDPATFDHLNELASTCARPWCTSLAQEFELLANSICHFEEQM